MFFLSRYFVILEKLIKISPLDISYLLLFCLKSQNREMTPNNNVKLLLEGGVQDKK